MGDDLSVPFILYCLIILQWNLDLTNLHITNFGITNDFLQPGKNYNKIYGTERRYNEPRSNEILVITNTIQKRKRKIFLDTPDITNKC